MALRLFRGRVRARPAGTAGGAVPRAALAALPGLRRGRSDPGERIAPDSGAARPADAKVRLILDPTVGAIPAQTDHLWQPPGTDPPVGPGEDRAADKEHQESAGQQVFHVGENSREAVI